MCIRDRTGEGETKGAAIKQANIPETALRLQAPNHHYSQGLICEQGVTEPQDEGPGRRFAGMVDWEHTSILCGEGGLRQAAMAY